MRSPPPRPHGGLPSLAIFNHPDDHVNRLLQIIMIIVDNQFS
jgi:hypothetical protein